MAETITNAGCAVVSASETEVYTCPAATTAVVRGTIANVDGTNSCDITIRQYVTNKTGGAGWINRVKTFTVAADETLTFGVWNLVAGDKIGVQSSADSDLECALDIIERT